MSMPDFPCLIPGASDLTKFMDMVMLWKLVNFNGSH